MVSYFVKVEKKLETSPGYWSHSLVGVYKKEDEIETKVGEFTRNYSGPGPFAAFKLHEVWYALYSPQYMYTRVMLLPECKDLGGEDKNNTPYQKHFCPREYLVPNLCIKDFKPGENQEGPYNPRHDPDKWAHKEVEGGYHCYTWPGDKESKHTPEEVKVYREAVEKSDIEYLIFSDAHPFVMKHGGFGFVSGCAWGDDSSDKLEFLDLSEVADGIIKRDQRFGYFVLPKSTSLKDAIDFDSVDSIKFTPDGRIDYSNLTIELARPMRIDLDGIHRSWWTDALFNKLEKKYSGSISEKEFIKFKEIINSFFAIGLDDGGGATDVDSRIQNLVELIANHKTSDGLFTRAFKKLLSLFGKA